MKGTDAMLADHKMIRKLLAEFRLDNPRFPQIAETAHRIIAGHAWFEDTLFFPAVEKSPQLARCFTAELYQEHRDIETLIALIRSPKTDAALVDGHRLQFLTLMETHFRKEEDALFPLTERILDAEGLNALGEAMRARHADSRAAAEHALQKTTA